MKKSLILVSLIAVLFASCEKQTEQDIKQDILKDVVFVDYLSARECFVEQTKGVMDVTSVGYLASVEEFTDARSNLFTKFPELQKDLKLFTELIETASSLQVLKSGMSGCHDIWDNCMSSLAVLYFNETSIFWLEFYDENGDAVDDTYIIHSETGQSAVLDLYEVCECETITAVCFCDELGETDPNLCFEGLCVGIQP